MSVNVFASILFSAVMPDTVKNVKVIQRGTTWLLLQAAFPNGIDNNICSDLSKSLKTASVLKISYTVTFLSELQQIQWLEQSRQYYQRFGMWRNLHSDKETLSHFSSVRYFPVSQVKVCIPYKFSITIFFLSFMICICPSYSQMCQQQEYSYLFHSGHN